MNRENIIEDKVSFRDYLEHNHDVLSEESLSNFGDKDYILERLHKELNIQFNTRRQILLKTIYTYIAG